MNKPIPAIQKPFSVKGIDRNDYSSIHSWLRYHHGKADRCESSECTKKSKNYQYALIKGKSYERVRGNFIMLCISCHAKYDVTDYKREYARKLLLGKKLSSQHRRRMSESSTQKKPIAQYSMQWELIATYESVARAVEATGLERSSLREYLKGKTKHAKGYYWKLL